MGNGGPLPENAKQVATWSTSSGIGSALVVWILMGGPSPDNGPPPQQEVALIRQEMGQLRRRFAPLMEPGAVLTESDLEALRRTYEPRLDRLDDELAALERNLQPLGQLNHMIPTLRLSVDDNTEALNEIRKEDLHDLADRLRQLEQSVNSMEKVFSEYSDWVRKLSDEGKIRGRDVGTLQGITQRLDSTLQQLQRTMDEVHRLQRNVRERLSTIENKVMGYRDHQTPSASGQWMDGLKPSPTR